MIKRTPGAAVASTIILSNKSNRERKKCPLKIMDCDVMDCNLKYILKISLSIPDFLNPHRGFPKTTFKKHKL